MYSKEIISTIQQLQILSIFFVLISIIMKKKTKDMRIKIKEL
jgi:hypothetical protein